MLDPMVSLLLALSYCALFGVAAAHKWRDPARLRAIVQRYRLVPASLVAAASGLVMMLETSITLGLLAERTRAAAAVTGAQLLAGYAAAMAINLRRGRTDLDCGCTGPMERRPVAGWMVVRNLALALLLCVLVVPAGTRPIEWVDAVSVVLGFGVIVMLYLALDQLHGRILPARKALEEP
jgi:hypothetical protein